MQNPFPLIVSDAPNQSASKPPTAVMTKDLQGDSPVLDLKVNLYQG